MKKLFLLVLVVFVVLMSGCSALTEKDINTSLDAWVDLQNKQSYLPAVSEMGDYENIQCKYQHRENLIVSSDAYILRATYSQENFETQKDYVLNSYSFQDTVTDEIREKIFKRMLLFRLMAMILKCYR